MNKILSPLILLLFVCASCKNIDDSKSKNYEETDSQRLEILKSIEKENNIYTVNSDGTKKQLTFNDSDSNPVLIESRDLVLFIRNRKENGAYRKYTRKQIMTVDINTLKENIITEKKPYQDGNDANFEIFNVINPSLSTDEKSIFFVTEKWATGNQLVKVNINTGKWTELFAAESFEIIREGNFKGNFITNRSEIRDKGRAVYHMIVDEAGKNLKDFANKESLEQFKSKYL